MKEAIANNIEYTRLALEFNKEYSINFFRISSDLVPFASHPICTFDWKNTFLKEFEAVGNLIKKYRMRVSMHPDQFVVLNSKSESVVENAIRELEYHADVLDLMNLDETHKIQIHVGGIFGDKTQSITRFIETYNRLPDSIKSRLVIENDDRLYSLKDCLEINEKTGIPILFDIFHHQCLHNGESLDEAFKTAASTWKKEDGAPMMDSSSQDEGARVGKHVESINLEDFKKYVPYMQKYNFDVILEIKDKEISTLKAISSINRN